MASTSALVLCMGILACVMKLWRADFDVPFGTPATAFGIVFNDSRYMGMIVKSIIDTGWWMTNPHLGAPREMQLYDFPGADNLNMATIKLLTLFSSNYALVLNGFYLLTFPLAVFSTMFVLGKFGVSYPAAIACGLLFAFTPYHFLRGEGHLLLSAYYPVPLVAMLCMWLWSGAPCKQPGQASDASGIALGRIAICALVMLIGSWEPYYVFYACFLLCVSGIGASASSRRLRPLGIALALSASIALVLLANFSPTIIYHWKHGANLQALGRFPGQADFYGLRIAQMLLPVTGHRLAALARLKHFYNHTSQPINENDAATLGIVGGAGFLFLVIRLLIGARSRNDRLDSLGVLVVAAVLLGIVGGFGSLFSYLITPQFRCYNRISIFIAFLSLFAVALVLDEFGRRLARRSIGRWAWYGMIAVVVCVGVLDQTTSAFAPAYDRLKAEDLSDADFVARIEATVPPEAMIFQIPVVPFPESPIVNKMLDYDLFRGYLHSKALRWSYGAIKGREAGRWAARVSRPADEATRILVLAGFSGIYVDRNGFGDHGVAIESQLQELLGESPLESRNGRLAFFDLRDFAEKLRQQYDPQQWQAARAAALRPAP